MQAPPSYVSIFVRDIYVQTRIGILAREKQSTQGLRVSIELYAEPVSYLRKVTERNIIDYDRIHQTVEGWSRNPHTDLIETYVRELLVVAFSFKQVTAARIMVGKPDIYESADLAGVETFLKRADFKKMRIRPPKKQKSDKKEKVRRPPAL
ncbi:MAG: dihydroneopterin aldolase [Alphaproteobacteria bacterium]